MDPLSPRLPRDHPLAGCEQKLWRGHQHFELLGQEIEALRDGEFDPASFRTEHEPNAKDTYQTVVSSVGQPPVRLATIIGDIVHNFRSSLDYLVFELAFLGLRGRRIPRYTAFPVCDTRGYWQSSRVQDTLLDGVMKEHRAMLYRAQPCYRRKDKPTPATLRRRPRSAAADLQSLWNEDKHRMIQLAVLAPFAVKPAITFDNCEPRSEPRIHIEAFGRPLKEGTVLFTIPTRPTGPDPEVHVNIEMTFHICLLDGFPVREFLRQVGNWITGMLQDFEPVFETPRARRLWGLPRGRWIEREPVRFRRPRPQGWTLADGQPLTPAE